MDILSQDKMDNLLHGMENLLNDDDYEPKEMLSDYDIAQLIAASPGEYDDKPREVSREEAARMIAEADWSRPVIIEPTCKYRLPCGKCDKTFELCTYVFGTGGKNDRNTVPETGNEDGSG